MGLLGKQRTALKVEGMTCGNCVGHVQRALEGVKGVQRAQVDLENGSATVTSRHGDVDALVAAVKAAGYKARPAEG